MNPTVTPHAQVNNRTYSEAMLPLRLLLLSAALCSACGGGGIRSAVVEGDIEVEYAAGGRGGDVLGSTRLPDRSRLWPSGKLRYYIETEKTNQDRPADFFLKHDEERILAAVAHYHETTCLRFERCEPEDACEQPYIRFISDAGACSSPLGIKSTKVNQINLSKLCAGVGAAVHEIGHSAGLMHEQARKDRDDYVTIVKDQVSGRGKFDVNFAKNSAASRDLLPYDYNSVMHYWTRAFAVGWEKTIIAPESIGQRSVLSAGDIGTLDFMYNGCREEYTEPICTASLAVDAVRLVPHSKPFMVEFNGQYTLEKTMTVKYGTDAPVAMVAYSKPDGTDIGDTGFSQVTYTPEASEAGKTRTLAVKFMGSDGTEATCSVTVKVADAASVCLGLPAGDPNVCSGRGVCVGTDVNQPCACNAGFGGRDCSGFANCPRDYYSSFDDNLGDWAPPNFKDLFKWRDTTTAAVGAGSMRVGKLPAVRGTVHLPVIDHVKPRSVTFFLRMQHTNDEPVVFFYDRLTPCFGFSLAERDGKKVAFESGDRYNPDAPAFTDDRFYAFKLNLNWDRRTFDLFVDGGLNMANLPFRTSCPNGLTQAVVSGYLWLDEFNLHCLPPPVTTDECVAMPCGMGQTCEDPNTDTDSARDYVCTCANGIAATGAPAECEKDECAEAPAPCGAGQTCTDPNIDAKALADYVCVCTNGVRATGAHATCEKDECVGGPCGVGQTCIDADKAANKLHDFTCTCDADAAISTANGPATCVKDECTTNLCGAGQACNDPAQAATSLKDFVCTCANGVAATGTSATCEKDECAGRPCGVGQTCIDADKAANKLHDYTCTCDNDVLLRATGAPVRQCVDDECGHLPCTDGQACADPDTSPRVKSDFVCKCTTGTMSERVGGPAVCLPGKKDECAVVPPPCGAQACTDPDQSTDVINDYVCTCAAGKGTATGAPAVCTLNECEGTNPCGPGQTCVDAHDAIASVNDFVCTCHAPQAGVATGKPATCNLDECVATPCGAGQVCSDPDKDVNSAGDFTCACANGATATGGAATCEKDECAAAAHPCGARQACTDRNKSFLSQHDFVCACAAAPTVQKVGGPATCSMNECDDVPCGAGQTCNDPVQTVGSTQDYTCACANGVRATGARATCEKDECAAKPCGANQECVDPDKKYTSTLDFVCACQADRTRTKTGASATCSMNECDDVPCGAGQTCNDPHQTPGSTRDYTCACANGVRTTGARATCEKDECAFFPCGAGQACTDPNKSFLSQRDFVCTCAAVPTVQTVGGPATCEKDECAAKPCDANQECVDPDKKHSSLLDFVCACQADRTRTKTGAPAVCKKDECDDVPCGAGQTCNDPVQTLGSTRDYTCTCSDGTTAKGVRAGCPVATGAPLIPVPSRADAPDVSGATAEEGSSGLGSVWIVVIVLVAAAGVGAAVLAVVAGRKRAQTNRCHVRRFQTDEGPDTGAMTAMQEYPQHGAAEMNATWSQHGSGGTGMNATYAASQQDTYVTFV